MVDSVIGRSLQRRQGGLDTTVSDAMCRILLGQATARVRANADAVATALFEGPKLDELRAKLEAWTPTYDTNLIAARRLVADATVEHGGYNQSFR